MKSLAIQNGDLVLGAEGFSTVTGQAKIRQEVGADLREPLGVDRFHPNWGSVLGQFVGTAIGSTTEVRIRAEVVRVIKNYVFLQADQIKVDTANSNDSRYGASEIIKDIGAVEIRQELDRLHIRINLTTMANRNVTLVQTVRL